MAGRAAGAVPAAGGRRGGGGGLLYGPIEDCTVTIKNQVYTGQALKPNPIVKDDGARLKKGTDYTVSYKKNTDIGTATVVIKGKGSYTGTVKATFKINPKAVAIKTLTAGRKKLTVRWKKGAGITGYQVQYSLRKDFSAKTTVAVKKAATTQATIKKLKANKTYYVRVRAYKTVGGKKYYSAWSKVKSAKVK